jgi:hypothetical protein
VYLGSLSEQKRPKESTTTKQTVIVDMEEKMYSSLAEYPVRS